VALESINRFSSLFTSEASRPYSKIVDAVCFNGSFVFHTCIIVTHEVCFYFLVNYVYRCRLLLSINDSYK